MNMCCGVHLFNSVASRGLDYSGSHDDLKAKESLWARHEESLLSPGFTSIPAYFSSCLALRLEMIFDR